MARNDRLLTVCVITLGQSNFKLYNRERKLFTNILQRLYQNERERV